MIVRRKAELEAKKMSLFKELEELNDIEGKAHSAPSISNLRKTHTIGIGEG